MGKIDEILKSEWNSAPVTNTYELQKCTRQLPQTLRTRLDERYSDLFDYKPLTEKQRVVSYKNVFKFYEPLLCSTQNQYTSLYRPCQNYVKEIDGPIIGFK